MVIGEGRRYCVDQPDGIPHLVDSPRAQRCDQHREQRHRWSDANAKRKKAGKPTLDWVPEPLGPQRRIEALLFVSGASAEHVGTAAYAIGESLKSIETNIRPQPGTDKYEILVSEIARIRAQCEVLRQVARRMGSE